MKKIRVLAPSDITELTMARLLLQRAGIPFVVENENYFGSVGGGISIGDTLIWISVPEQFAGSAFQLLTPDPASY